MVSYSVDPATVNNSSPATDQAVFEADKRAVYKHPLFPLLALIFERCEQATQCSEILNSEGFTSDIRAFVQHQERDARSILTNDAEVDGLMIKAIQVLRIHLLELEKVQELCKDFCTRYITCLRSKMQSENLLKPASDYARSYSENNSSSEHSSDSNSPLSYSPRPFHGVSNIIQNEPPFKDAIHSDYSQNSPAVAIQSPPSNHTLSANCNFSDASHPTSPSSPGTVPGTTPLSQIGAHSVSSADDPAVLRESLSPLSATSCDEPEDQFGNRRKLKRGILPKYATGIMRSWLFQHLVHPYPTEDEKKQIAAQTNLTLLQVNNWFINARRRILQPMLDASAPVTTEDTDSECSENELRISENNQKLSGTDDDDNGPN